MREYAKINVNFSQLDDLYVPPLRRVNHQIRIDPIAHDEVLLSFLRTRDDEPSLEQASALEKRLLEHWRVEGDKRAKEGRFVAAVSAMREALRVVPEHAVSQQSLKTYAQQQQQLDELRLQANAMRQRSAEKAIELFLDVLKIRPDEAGAHGRLGTLYAQQGDRVKAAEHLHRVADIDPDDQYGLSMLGWLAYLDSDFSKAANYYQQADAIEPFSTKINHLWGASLARIGRFAEADERLQVSLKSDPKNLDAMRELIQVKLLLSELPAAAEWAEQAARLTAHRSVRELMVLAHCQNALDRKTLAADVVQLALSVTGNNPAETAKIKQWCQENAVSFGVR